MAGMTDDQISRIERALGDMRVAVARGFAETGTKLEDMKDHEPRIRKLESNAVTRADVHDVVTTAVSAVESRILTLEDVKVVVGEAIAAARRLSWRDVGALIAAISTSVGLVLAVGKLAGLTG